MCCSVVSVLCHAAANVNDRSMTGERDSEVAIRFEDKEMVREVLNLYKSLSLSLSFPDWFLFQLISYSLSFSQLDIAFLFTHSLRLTVPWMVSRIKLASFRTQFVSTSSSEIVYDTAQLLLKWNHWSSFFVKSCQLLLVRCLLRCLRLNKAVTYNVL